VSTLVSIALAVAITCGLYFGREILMPLALSVLLSFVLAPLVRLLQRARVPRGVSVLLVAFIAFAGIGLLGTVVATQIAGLAGELPNYERTIRSKVISLRKLAAGNGAIDRAADLVENLNKEMERPKNGQDALRQKPADPTDAKAQEPIPVEVRQPDGTPLKTLASFGNALLHPAATAGIIAVFTIFILLQREELRNRVIRLAGAHDLQRTTAAINDAARRLSRYFLVQLALNTGFGVIIGVGLWIIGVPSPALFGILAGVLRFVPYVGAIIAALLPMALAAAVDPGWTMMLWTAALFAIVEPVVGQAIEPLVYGHSTGLSPVAVVISATFWTWLWGPIGLVMATPLTACVVVLGRHIERFEVFDVLLGDRPALSAPEVFYQRMLARDPVEAMDQAETCLKESALAEYLDNIALPGLRLASQDELRGALEDDRMVAVRDSVVELAEDLAELEPQPAETTVEGGTAAAPAPEVVDILCIGLRTPLDDAAGQLFALLAREQGMAVRCVGPEALSLASLFTLDTHAVPVICLSMLEAPGMVHVRHALRRLRRKAPQATLVVGAWQEPGAKASEDLKRAAAPVTVVTSYSEAIELARTTLGRNAVETASPAATQAKAS
jgi:predicted PurR-regulated permease PerM